MIFTLPVLFVIAVFFFFFFFSLARHNTMRISFDFETSEPNTFIVHLRCAMRGADLCGCKSLNIFDDLISMLFSLQQQQKQTNANIRTTRRKTNEQNVFQLHWPIELQWQTTLVDRIELVLPHFSQLNSQAPQAHGNINRKEPMELIEMN